MKSLEFFNRCWTCADDLKKKFNPKILHPPIKVLHKNILYDIDTIILTPKNEILIKTK